MYKMPDNFYNEFALPLRYLMNKINLEADRELFHLTDRELDLLLAKLLGYKIEKHPKHDVKDSYFEGAHILTIGGRVIWDRCDSIGGALMTIPNYTNELETIWLAYNNLCTSNPYAFSIINSNGKALMTVPPEQAAREMTLAMIVALDDFSRMAGVS